ncbi:hypothetical protein Peur_046524 [Populus x canadensis]
MPGVPQPRRQINDGPWNRSAKTWEWHTVISGRDCFPNNSCSVVHVGIVKLAKG